MKIVISENDIKIENPIIFKKGMTGVKIEVEFQQYWTDFNKTLVFKYEFCNPIAVLITKSTEEITIPNEVLANEGKFKIGAYGQSGEKTTPTFWSDAITIKDATDTYGVAPQPPTPSVYDTLINLGKDTKAIADSVRADADEGKFNGKDGKDGKDGIDGDITPEYRQMYQDTIDAKAAAALSEKNAASSEKNAAQSALESTNQADRAKSEADRAAQTLTSKADKTYVDDIKNNLDDEINLLTGEVSDTKLDIGNIKTEQTLQNKAIQKNVDDIIAAKSEIDRLAQLTVKIESWEDISKAAKTGYASTYINIGDIFYANRTIEDKKTSIPWHIADIIPFVTPEGKSQEAVIIQQHRVLPEEIAFDNYEAFYIAKDNPLEAGTYHITFKENWGTYHKAGDSWSFTLSKSVPIGGCLGGFHDTPYSGFGSANVQSFNNLADTVPIETAKLRNGAEGTKLGDFTFKGNNGLNSVQRTCYGYNNYKQSFQRQYLNSTGKGWWKPQNEYDLPPTNYADINGFKTGWDENFLKYLKPFKQATIRNTVTDNREEDITEDIFTLPSLEQMYIEKQVSGEGETLKYWKEVSGNSEPFPWYKETPELVHLDTNGTPRYVRLRSASVYGANFVWFVNPSGYVNSNFASLRFCGAPLAIIY